MYQTFASVGVWFRLMTKESSDCLAETFGNNLKDIGRMLIVMDRLNDPGYTKRLWCLFEVHVPLFAHGITRIFQITNRPDSQLFVTRTHLTDQER